MEGVYYAYEPAPMSSAGVRARTGHSEQMALMCAAAALEARAEQNLREAFLASSLDSGEAKQCVALATVW